MSKPLRTLSKSLATGCIACFPLLGCQSATDANNSSGGGSSTAGETSSAAGSAGLGAAAGGGVVGTSGATSGTAGAPGTSGSAGNGSGTSGAGSGTGGTAAAGGGGVPGTAGSSAAGAGGKAAGGASGSAGSVGTGGTGGSSIVGATPPMGWNSWNNYGCTITESIIRSVADTFVSSGMTAVGYKYVNIDDCWMSGRDSSGNLVADATKFPSGIKALADYAHGKGLKLGIYETPSAKTCGGKTGGQGHEVQDANTFASWGIDYLKYDDCGGALSSFKTMHDALVATGRPIFYSINPVYGPGSCVPPTCSVDEVKLTNMWRIGFDITNTWASFTGLIDIDEPLSQYAGPGHWNDPDMLEVGRPGLSADENRSHLGMWAMLAAPLIAGNDIAGMSAATKAILTNADVIAVDQDPLGKQATVVSKSGSNQVWAKKLSGTNTYAVALFNRSGSATTMTVKWSDVGLPAGSATVRDLYAQKDLGPSTDSYTSGSIPSHGIVMLKIVSAP